MKKLVFLFSILLTLFLNYSCASTGFLMARAKVTLLSESYPSKSKDAKIDVFLTNKPDQVYTEFAIIKCNDTDDKWCMSQILIKAREIGADAVIITGKANTYGIGIPIGNYSTYVINQDYGMTAVAIKYK